MDTISKSPSKKGDNRDLKTEQFVQQSTTFLLSTHDPDLIPIEQILLHLSQQKEVIPKYLLELVKRTQISFNLVNFCVVGVTKLLKQCIMGSKENSKMNQIDKIWEIVCLLLQKIIQKSNVEKQLTSQEKEVQQSLSNTLVDKLIVLLFTSRVQLKQKSLFQLVTYRPDIQKKLQKFQSVQTVEGCNETMKFYTLVLCLPNVNIEYVIILSTIFQRDTRIKKEQNKNLYKLQKWLSTRTLTYDNIISFLQLVKLPQRCTIFKDKRYQDVTIHKKIFIDPSYKCLIPCLLQQLLLIKNPAMEQDKQKLISFLLQKFCFQDGYLVQNILKMYHQQDNKLILSSMYKYLKFQFFKEISIRKMKLLFQFFKNQVSLIKSQSESTSIFKLSEFTKLMYDISRHHVESITAIQFVQDSNITFTNINLFQQIIIMMISINRYDKKIQVLTLDLNSKDKQKLYIMLEIDCMEHAKRTVVVLVEKEVDANVKVLIRQPVAYINDNYNEFLFVLKFTDNSLDLCVNSSYFSIPYTYKSKMQKNIENIQLGKTKRKKNNSNLNQSEYSSFIGMLKMLYVYEKLQNVDTIAQLYSMLNSQCKQKISSFPKLFNAEPIISMAKSGDKLFTNTKARSGILVMNKYQQIRHNVFIHKIPSMIEIMWELGGYDMFLYLIYSIYSKLQTTQNKIVADIFSIMKHLAVNDKKHYVLKWMYSSNQNAREADKNAQFQNDKQLMGLSHFLRLLFYEGSNSTELLQKYILPFIFYFEQIPKNQVGMEEKGIQHKMLEMQIIIKILLNFDIWSWCGKKVQMLILKEAQKRIKKAQILQMIKYEMMDHSQWTQFLKHLQDSKSRGKDCSSSIRKNPNRVLNNLLMILILHSTVTEVEDHDNSTSITTSLNSIPQLKSPSLTKSMSLNPNVSCQQAQQIQCKVVQLIDIVINIPNDNQEIESKLVSQIRMMFQYIIEKERRGVEKFPNRSSIYILLNYIYINISSGVSPRFTEFFFKKTEPFYRQQNCLLVALLIQNLQPGNSQTLKLILQIIKQLICKIKLRLKTNQSTGRFVRQAIQAYRQNKYQYQPEYLVCFLNWILQNQYGDVKLTMLFKAIEKHKKNVQSLEVLQSLLLKMDTNNLIKFINHPLFINVFKKLSSVQDKQYNYAANITANKLFKKVSEVDKDKANQFYHLFVHVFHPYPFKNSNKQLSIVHPYLQNDEVLSICELLSVTPILRAPQNTHEVTTTLNQICPYFGGTLAHYLLKCQLSVPLIQQLQQIVITEDADCYYSIPNLVDYFVPDILLLKLISKQYGQQIWSRTFAYLKKSKAKIVKNMKVFSSLYKNMEQFLEQISSIDEGPHIYKQRKLGILQDLKKIYCQLNHLINEEFVKQKQTPEICEFVARLLDCEGRQAFQMILKDRPEEIDNLQSLLQVYSTKDLKWTNRLYELTQQYFQSQTQIGPVEESSITMKPHLMIIAQRNFTHQLNEIDITSTKSQQEWRRIVRNNLNLIEKSNPNGAIYKFDLHQCPNFYHLNIKLSKVNEKRRKYPRRNLDKEGEDSLALNTILSRRGSIRDKSKSTLSIPQSTHSQQQNSMQKKSSKEQQTTKKSNTKYFCEYVTQKGVYFGQISYNLQSKQIQFRSVSENLRPAGRQYNLSTSKHFRLKEQKNKIINLKEVNDFSPTVFTRRYILRHTAFEIFTRDKSYFFNLFQRKDRDIFLNSLKGVDVIKNRRQDFINKDFTSKWESGKLNNFEYLMLINRYSGRTYNDLSQFPIFPWVVSSFNTIDFLKQFRDLSLPMGKLNSQRFQGYKQRMQDGGFSQQQKFLYGTFYSNPTLMYNFFIRLEPFISLHWDHQGQKIDHADRLFSGIQEQYYSATTNTSDVKQLIPQFYYWPEFLKNRNQLRLGKKQKGQQVNDIVLPKWAKTAQQFIFKMRIALQSTKVTQNLNYWIDLVFGEKSQRRRAIQCDNLFHPLAYEIQQTGDEEKDIFTTIPDDDDLIVAQLTISQFGQVPQALFSKPHPKKKGRNKMDIDHCSDYTPQYKNALKLLPYADGCVVVAKDYIYFVETMMIVDYKKSSKEFKLPKKQSKFNEYESKDLSYCIVNSKLQIYSELVGGKLTIYQAGKQISSWRIQSYTHLVTTDRILIYTYNNKICVQTIFPNFRQLSTKKILYGHHDKIYKLAINQGIDILLTVDYDNLVLLHYLHSQKLIRTFNLDMIPNQEIKEVRIHDMGYFVFLTSMSRVLIYSYFGELFLETDFVCLFENENLTNIRFMSEYFPTILMSSSRGYIYKVNWFDLWKQRKKYPYRPYILRKKEEEILHNCQNYDYNDDNLKNQGDKGKEDQRRSILDFHIMKALNFNNGGSFTFILVVLYKSGVLRNFSERKRAIRNIQKQPLLRQMGFYGNDAKS